MPNTFPRETKENTQDCTTTSPAHIMQIGMGFWASKTLLSAVELGIFTKLAKKKMNAQELRTALGLHERSALDFFDALVALGILERTNGVYANTPDAEIFLDKAKPSYIGGILEMSNQRLYSSWANLTPALKTGEPQYAEKEGGEDLFANLYANPEKLKEFLKAMTGISLGSAIAISAKFNWEDYKTFADVGCSEGAVPCVIAAEHPHLKGIGYDLAAVQPIFEEYAAAKNLKNRVTFQSGDFFKKPLPNVDVIIMGHILHDWDMPTKEMLIKKAYDALPEGGAFIVYEALIDDDRNENAFGLLMSLNMLIETNGGFDYTGADCSKWMQNAGFKKTYVEHLVGPDSMVVGIK